MFSWEGHLGGCLRSICYCFPGTLLRPSTAALSDRGNTRLQMLSCPLHSATPENRTRSTGDRVGIQPGSPWLQKPGGLPGRLPGAAQGPHPHQVGQAWGFTEQRGRGGDDSTHRGRGVKSMAGLGDREKWVLSGPRSLCSDGPQKGVSPPEGRVSVQRMQPVWREAVGKLPP